MKRSFTVSVSREGKWFLAQCLEIAVARQGETESEALANLAEALQLYFDVPLPSPPPQVRQIEVEVAS